MAFDVVELMNDLFPKSPKPGEWWSVGQGLPNDFQEVLFLVDDESAEGRVYYGFKDGNKFVVQYEFSEFKIGGTQGVGFWSPVPKHDAAFVNTCR